MGPAGYLYCALYFCYISITSSSGVRSWSLGTAALADQNPMWKVLAPGQHSPTHPTLPVPLPPPISRPEAPHPQRPFSGALACPRVALGCGLTLTFLAGRSGSTRSSPRHPCGSPGQYPRAARQGPAHSRTGGWRVCSHGLSSSSEAPWTRRVPWTRGRSPGCGGGPSGHGGSPLDTEEGPLDTGGSPEHGGGPLDTGGPPGPGGGPSGHRGEPWPWARVQLQPCPSVTLLPLALTPWNAARGHRSPGAGSGHGVLP